jgi:hypothetical protein
VKDASTPHAGEGAGSSIEYQRLRAAIHSRLFGSEAAAPTKIDRFTVLERLGAGAMGVVFAAYDPQLDRQVALKLLRSDAAGVRGEDRLLREAQALGRLNHPNVVAVHEVGTHDGHVFVAMEFVHGATARAWLLERARTVREILDVYAQAGRGLAAAHAAALVHRDFKPDNVLVGEEGRVRVADFGLARPLADRSGEPAEPSPRSGSVLDTPLTQTGAVVGTPAYMAPELFVGAVADAKSDQFAFAVSLWEALFGARPFAGAQPDELVRAALRGELDEPADASRVPRRVRRALARALAGPPGQRWPSMDALLVELGVERPWRLRLAAAGLVAAMAGGAAAWWTASREPACTDGPDRLAEIWDEPVRRSLADGFAATGVAGASERWSRASANLDAFASDWLAVLDTACATGSRRDLQLVSRCLDDRRIELREVVASLAEPDDARVAYAIHATASLPSPRECEDVQRLLLVPPPDTSEANAEARDAVQVQIAHAEALTVSGRAPEAMVVGEAALAAARALPSRQLEARAHWVLARVYDSTDPTRVDAELESAAAGAVAAGDERLAARATAWRLWYTTATHAASAPGRRQFLWPIARALAERTGDPLARAIVLELDGEAPDVATAAASLQACIAMDPEGTRGALSQVATRCRRAYGRLLAGTGEVDLGLSEMREHLRQREAYWGAGHWITAGARIEVAQLEIEVGHTEAARETLRQALSVHAPLVSADEAAQGDYVNDFAVLLAPLEACRLGPAAAEEVLQAAADALQAARTVPAKLSITRADWALTHGDVDGAALLLDRAEASCTRACRPDDAPNIALRRAHIAALRGRLDEAVAIQRSMSQSLPATDERYPEAACNNHAMVHASSARSLRAAGEPAAALVAAGMSHVLTGCIADPSSRAELSAALGVLLVDLQHFAAARDVLAPVHATMMRECPSAPWLGWLFVPHPGFALARALWETGDRSAGLELAARVRADLAALGPGRDAERRDVDRWLASHRLDRSQ